MMAIEPRDDAMLDAILDLCDAALAADTPQAASAAFSDAARRQGATYLQTRVYRRPLKQLTSATHWAAGGFVARYAPSAWAGSAAFNHVCFVQNPLLEPIRRGLTRYRFSDFAAHDDRAYADYWSALSEAGIAEALCATAYGRDRAIASIHLGLGTRDIAPATSAALHAGASVLVERLMEFGGAGDAEPAPTLSHRERDAMAFVAEGKTDWEIATIFGVAEPTARFHVDNARRKLGAVNRSHAVARFLAIVGPF
jgi:LuxR family quorum sensing-dependent transcriptional regulator